MDISNDLGIKARQEYWKCEIDGRMNMKNEKNIYQLSEVEYKPFQKRIQGHSNRLHPLRRNTGCMERLSKYR
jgi:hypothetical protein